MCSAKNDDRGVANLHSKDSRPVEQQEPYFFAHISDLHLSDLSNVRATALFNKRFMGYLSWRSHRRHEHRKEVLDALMTDLHRIGPRHIVITGDLTHLGLPEEFGEAADWLSRLGPPSRVSVIPGNHEAYIRTRWAETLAGWLPYMCSDDPQLANREQVFPSLRIRGAVAFIGVTTASPSPPFMATGRLGGSQLRALDGLLTHLQSSGLFRVLLIHHPPLQETSGWRKRLLDSSGLREILKSRSVDLVLHGHTHRRAIGWLNLPQGGATPVIGVPSGSAMGLKPGRGAGYNLYSVRRGVDRWALEISMRNYDPEAGEFVAAGGLSPDPSKQQQREHEGNGDRSQGGDDGAEVKHQSEIGQ